MAGTLVHRRRIDFGCYVGESSRSTYRKNNPIATNGKTRQLVTTMIEGKYEAENNIVKFPNETTQLLKRLYCKLISSIQIIKIFNKLGRC